MCGRFNLWASPAELAEFFELFREPEWTPRYNLGPMQQILVIRKKPDGVRLAEPLQWGIVPRWAKSTEHSAQMVMARCETIASKPAYSEPFRQHRGLIPINGFYEWEQWDSKTKQAWHIYSPSGIPLALAAIWEHWQAPDGSLLESCAVITTHANELMGEFCDRMPVILPKETWETWLSIEQPADLARLSSLLVPCPSQLLVRTPVSSYVNSVSHDSPECIEPAKLPRTLF